MKKYFLFLILSLFFLNCNTTKNSTTTNNGNSKNPAEKKVDCIDTSKINPNMNCLMIYKPVCGCDKKTYENSCFAEAAGVTKWTEGKCE
ncbi:MAG: kazal domain protein [Bacteroidetes bacterium]|nr:MAG: kazal domain protein [Bacteroidota bacterium]TAG90898.1 MAG: kazal domain protein [Bacteroidota bacterium]